MNEQPEIQRYGLFLPDVAGPTYPDECGDWVRYDDHKRALEAQDAVATSALEMLQNGANLAQHFAEEKIEAKQKEINKGSPVLELTRRGAKLSKMVLGAEIADLRKRLNETEYDRRCRMDERDFARKQVEDQQNEIDALAKALREAFEAAVYDYPLKAATERLEKLLEKHGA